MVATLAGLGALLFGLALLLLPLLATELSRPGDSAWGALVLVLALVLVTSAERLNGSPMLAVISGGLLVGRLTVEVGRGRWRQLSPEEQGRLGTRERWLSSLHQARVALAGLLEPLGQQASALLARWRQPVPPKASGKRWVRPEPAAGATPGPEVPEVSAEPEARAEPEVIEVSDFLAIDALLQAAPAAPDAPVAPDAPAASGAGMPATVLADDRATEGERTVENGEEGGGAG
jgi:hypothetical protein